ncbi:MAG: prepilin-type N-terminal cleavage/methylation domain-containing protein, partial [Gammaproteobacteria bacterium]|nr:prepilin-type N-terminal cleavage/methylation domain-containing protein [Gammaproteobacteria bacterium]
MAGLRYSRGFTLVEVLVALAVFAVVGLMSAQLMSRTLANHESLSERSARLAEVQRAMLILKR